MAPPIPGRAVAPLVLDPPAPFDADVVEAAAHEHGLDAEALADVLARHRRLLADFGDLTVSDIVYEWRRSLSPDPLVARDGDVYYLEPPEHVWADLLGRLALSDGEAAALRAVHERQFASDRGRAREGVLVLAAE